MNFFVGLVELHTSLVLNKINVGERFMIITTTASKCESPRPPPPTPTHLVSQTQNKQC